MVLLTDGGRHGYLLDVWASLKASAAANPDVPTVLILVALDVDALAACAILMVRGLGLGCCFCFSLCELLLNRRRNLSSFRRGGDGLDA